MAEIINLDKPKKPLLSRLKSISALIFDWDGVFNSGYKGIDHASGYFEPDILGLNMLRFSFWLKTNSILPVVIISGAENPNSKALSQREHFNFLLNGVFNKGKSLDVLSESHGLDIRNAALFFDDLNDLSMLPKCGVTSMIGRDASSASQKIIHAKYKLDYISNFESGGYALREIFERMLEDLDMLENIIDHRSELSDAYLDYMKDREKIKLKVIV